VSDVQTGSVTTKVPARLDRLPWSRWHGMIVIGLGTVWVMDGLEVTIVGNISGQISKPGSGIEITQSQLTGAGAAAGALLTVPATNNLPVAVGWRVCFGLGAVLGVVVLLVRRNVPESPRWLFIHGRDKEAEKLVDGIEQRVLFFASAGTSSAYLTVSEVFPMETRALAIAFFYAIGTAAGGITGLLLFSSLVSSGKVADTVLAFCIGASLMILAGLVEVFLGVRAERRGLEDIAQPLTASDAGPQPQPARVAT
jgi:MFS family permease